MLLESERTTITPGQLPDFLKTRMREFYSAGVPDFARERLETELRFMKTSNGEEELLLCYELSRIAARSGHILQANSSSVGSFLVFLLTDSRINPLPAHYYCRQCGYSELAANVILALDLPSKNCPHCGAPMDRDGFSLPAEIVWRSNGTKKLSLSYGCSEGFLPYGYRAIKEFYAERNRAVLPMGTRHFCTGRPPVPTRELKPLGVVVLPEGAEVDSYPQFLTYLSDGTPCFEGYSSVYDRMGIEQITLFSTNDPKSLKRAQDAVGRFCDDMPFEALLEVTYRDIKNTSLISADVHRALRRRHDTFYDIACALTINSNTYSDQGERARPLDVIDLEEFKLCPICCIEDIFDRMVAAGWERRRAAEVTEMICKGDVFEDPSILEHLHLPDDLAASVAHCVYLFPRGYGVRRLLSLIMLASYMKEDPYRYFDAISVISEDV